MKKYLLKAWHVLRFFLIPFSFIYGGVVMLRNFLYDVGAFRVKSLPRSVISVGNIVAGGTGKTPVVEWLGEYLASVGKNVAILSRGYSRKTKGFVLVSDGKEILSKPDECGDEPFQMALKSVENNFNWIIAVCEDRYYAGLKVLENFNIDVFVLDDGFQRRDLRKDMDILIVSKDDVNEFLIPAGLKREPLASVKRADVILSREDSWEDLEIYLSGKPVLRCKFGYKLLEIRKFFDYILLERPFKSKKIVAFSGIGKHKGFIKILKDNEFEIVREFEFPDHYRYNRRDIIRIIKAMDLYGAEYVVTTEKDYARLFEMKELKKLPFFYTRIGVEFYSGSEELKQKILGLVG